MQIIKKLKSDRNQLKSLMFEFEDLVFRNVKESYPDNWDEDSIIGMLLWGIRELFSGKKLYLPGNSLHSRWSVYRASGAQEHWLGDIAFMFKISFHDGSLAEGVAVLGVQKRDPGKNSFSALRKDHLQRMNSAAPHSQLVLLDYDPVAVTALPSQPEAILGSPPSVWDHWMPFTHAVSVPANAALALGEKSTGLYKVALPLAYQFCYRYLNGLDLDYGHVPMEIVAGRKPERGLPRYLVTVALAFGGSKLQEDFDFERASFSSLE
jgi:hypothetical protein